jgi:hypothetical protein
MISHGEVGQGAAPHDINDAGNMVVLLEQAECSQRVFILGN